MPGVGFRGSVTRAPVLVIISVILLALLAFNLRNLDVGPEELPPSPDREVDAGAEAGFGSGEVLRAAYVFSVIVLVVIVATGIVVTLLSKQPLRTLLSPWELLGTLLAGLLLIVLFYNWSDFNAWLQGFTEGISEGGITSDPGDGSGGWLNPLGIGGPQTIASIGIVSILTVYLIIFSVTFFPKLYRILTDKGAPPSSPRRDVAKALRTAIADLEGGGELREVVLRCYRTMVLLFASRGVVQAPHHTAREFEGRALAGLGVSRENITRLTSLFEEARYSTHAIGQAQRDEAISTLAAIRGEVEAGA